MRSVSSFLPLFVVALWACSARDPGIQYRGNRGGYDPPSAPTGNGGGEQPAYDAGGGAPWPAEPDGSSGNSADASSPMPDDGGRTIDAGYGDAAHIDSGIYGDGGSGDSGATQGLLARCASDVNAARAQYGLPALTRASDLETFAAQAVVSDAMANVIDGYFANNGGAGVSSAEDELDGAEFDQGASAQDVMDLGIQYEEQGYLSGNGNLLSQQFSQLGCGVTIAGDGNAWVAIEYR